MLTDEQKHIVCDSDKDDILLINAYAGTGKTTTLFFFAKARPDLRILYLAFNKAMAIEAQEKFQALPNVTTSTVHSLAFKYYGWKFKSRLGQPRALSYTDCLPENTDDQWLVSNICLSWFNDYLSSSYTSIEEYVVNRHPKDDSVAIDPDQMIQILESIWVKMIQDDNACCPHNLYLKMLQLSPLEFGFDCILVDEAQDITDCMIEIVLNQCSRKVLIGDTYQQIYGWNGAINSLKKLEGRGQVKYLTQSFRCPENVARQADKYLQLQAAPERFKGTSRMLPGRRNEKVYISRTNAGLFDFAANHNSKLYFVGGINSYRLDIIAEIKKLKMGHVADVKDPFLKKFKSYDLFCDYARKSNDHEIGVRIRIADKYPNVDLILSDIESRTVFKPQDADFILSTAHKVKGQEFDAVFLANDFFDVRSAVRKNHKKVSCEELNLIYVAMTRCKHTLYANCQIEDSDVLSFREAVKSKKITMW
jgi:F-box protein, helicase, 18